MGGGISKYKSGRQAQRTFVKATKGSLERIRNDELEDAFTELEQMQAKLNGIEIYVKTLRSQAPRGPPKELERSFKIPDTRQSELLKHLGDMLKDPETHYGHLQEVDLLLDTSKRKFDEVKTKMNNRRDAWQEKEHYVDKAMRQATARVSDAESSALATTSAKKKKAEEDYALQERMAREALHAFSAKHQEREINKMLKEISLYNQHVSEEAGRRAERFKDLAIKFEAHSTEPDARPFAYWTSDSWNPGVVDFVAVSEQEASALKEMCGLAKDFGGRDVKCVVDYEALKFTKAWRVENFDLWKTYKTEKDKIRSEVQQLKEGLVPVIKLKPDFSKASETLNPELDKDVNEVYLAHGTDPKNLLNIFQNGLNERFSEGKFGQGSYLAEDFAKCNQYCTVDMKYSTGGDLKALHSKLFDTESDHCGRLTYIVLCRAMMGCFVSTKDGERKVSGTGSIWSNPKRELALIEGAIDSRIHYHALLVETGGSIKRFREFVFFHSTRIYPEYLIAIQRVNRVDLD